MRQKLDKTSTFDFRVFQKEQTLPEQKMASLFLFT